MKLYEFIHNISDFIKEHPEAKNFDVFTAKDDEGNGYNKVYNTPSLGFYDGQDFNTDTNIKKPNAVCIN